MVAVTEPVLTGIEMGWKDYRQQLLTPILLADITDPEIFQNSHSCDCSLTLSF